jgi:hypothetical protein
MKLSEFNKLKKLMMMTTSSNDGECLNALRLANGMLMAENVNWDEVLDRSVTVVHDEPTPATVTPAPGLDGAEITQAFNIVYGSRMGDSFRTFIDSLHSQWETRGSLTQKQITALYNAARRLDPNFAAGWTPV